MKKIIDFFIKRIIIRVFILSLYLFFILVGIIAALVSALIEYEVFSGLLKKATDNNFHLSIPLLVVLVFEVAKTFLIFLHKHFSQSNNEDYLSNKAGFLGLRYTLVFISVLATLLYAFYNLHNPEYETTFNKEKAAIIAKYERRRADLKSNFDNQIAQQTAPYKSEIERHEGSMEQEKQFRFRKDSTEYRGPRYKEAKQLKEQAQQNMQNVIEDLNAKMNTEIAALFEKQDQEIQHLKEQLKTSASAGNKMLSATLQVINMKAEFPQEQYIIAIAVLSLILSLGLELTIWAVFTVLAINHGDVFDTEVKSKNLDCQHEAMNDTIDSMNETKTKTFEKNAKRELNSIKDIAKTKSKQYRNATTNIFK